MPGTTGPSPRSSTENGTPRSALTREPSTLSAMLKAFSSARGEGRPAVPQQHDPVRAAADVVQAVGEGVEVLPVPVREAERLAHLGEEGGLGVARASSRRRTRTPTRRARPCGVRRRRRTRPCHRWIPGASCPARTAASPLIRVSS